MTTIQDNLLDWLRDAHAMEQQAENMLTSQVERLEHYPQLRARIQQHGHRIAVPRLDGDAQRRCAFIVFGI